MIMISMLDIIIIDYSPLKLINVAITIRFDNMIMTPKMKIKEAWVSASKFSLNKCCMLSKEGFLCVSCFPISFYLKTKKAAWKKKQKSFMRDGGERKGRKIELNLHRNDIWKKIYVSM